jgi:hypothetical protein
MFKSEAAVRATLDNGLLIVLPVLVSHFSKIHSFRIFHCDGCHRPLISSGHPVRRIASVIVMN